MAGITAVTNSEFRELIFVLIVSGLFSQHCCCCDGGFGNLGLAERFRRTQCWSFWKRRSPSGRKLCFRAAWASNKRIIIDHAPLHLDMKQGQENNNKHYSNSNCSYTCTNEYYLLEASNGHHLGFIRFWCQSSSLALVPIQYQFRYFSNEK